PTQDTPHRGLLVGHVGSHRPRLHTRERPPTRSPRRRAGSHDRRAALGVVVRTIAGAAERGPVLSSAVAIGGLAVLTFTVLSGTDNLTIISLVAVLVLAVAARRSLLQWQNLLVAVIVIIL